MTESNILDLYRREVDNARDRHYFHYSPDGQRVLGTTAFFDRTAGLASGLEKLGVKRGDRVMLLSDNRPEWHMVDLAVADLGGVDVPVYGTLNPEQVAYQAKDAGAKAAVVENHEQMARCRWTRWLTPGPVAMPAIFSGSAPRASRPATC